MRLAQLGKLGKFTLYYVSISGNGSIYSDNKIYIEWLPRTFVLEQTANSDNSYLFFVHKLLKAHQRRCGCADRGFPPLKKKTYRSYIRRI